MSSSPLVSCSSHVTFDSNLCSCVLFIRITSHLFVFETFCPLSPPASYAYHHPPDVLTVVRSTHGSCSCLKTCCVCICVFPLDLVACIWRCYSEFRIIITWVLCRKLILKSDRWGQDDRMGWWDGGSEIWGNLLEISDWVRELKWICITCTIPICIIYMIEVRSLYT